MAFIIERVCPVETVISMFDYTSLLGIDELEFWGVYRGDGPIDPPTRYWIGSERKMLGDYLLRAENMVERQMQVHLEPKWVDDTWEEEPWEGNPHELNWKRFISGGRRATSIYAAATPITYAGDYGYVTVAHGGIGNAAGVRVWYDNTQLPIEYSRITWGATTIALEFPRERLVDPQVMDPDPNQSQERGVMWETITNFLETLTVAREYHDPSVNGQFVYSELCGCNCDSGCARCCQDACIVASQARVGTVSFWPAAYDDGWSRVSCTLACEPVSVRAAYRSGLRRTPLELQDAVVRLAHTLMPENPCPLGRDPQHRFWKRDREIREISIKEVLNCPWGNMSGAWFAWNVVSNHAENYGKGGGYL